MSLSIGTEAPSAHRARARPARTHLLCLGQVRFGEPLVAGVEVQGGQAVVATERGDCGSPTCSAKPERFLVRSKGLGVVAMATGEIWPSTISGTAR